MSQSERKEGRSTVRGRLLLGVSVLLCAVLFGCANHIEFVESERDDTSERVLESEFAVRAPSDFVEDPILELQFVKRQRVELTTRRSRSRDARVTPYMPARELFEVPAGLVALPCALVLGVVDVASFGSLPNESSYRFGAWAVSALNPLMNTEDVQRSSRRAGDARHLPVDVQTLSRELPVVAATVYAAFGGEAGGVVRSFETDAAGRVEIELLDLLPDELSSPPQRLIAELHLEQAEQPDAARMLYVDRALGQRLRQAVPILARVRSPQADPEELAASIYILDGIGFPGRAARIREQVTYRFRDQRSSLRAFERALDRRYVNPAGVTAWGAEESEHLSEPADLEP